MIEIEKKDFEKKFKKDCEEIREKYFSNGNDNQNQKEEKN